MAKEIISFGIPTIIVTYLILKDKFLYPEIFINTFVMGYGLIIMSKDFWKVGEPILDVLTLSLIAFGIISCLRALSNNLFDIKQCTN